MNNNPLSRWASRIDGLPQSALAAALKIILIGALLSLFVFIPLLVFQSWVLIDQRHSLHCVVEIDNRLSDALDQAAKIEANNETFFDLVSQLITLGQRSDTEAQAERQKIIQQLNDLQAQRSSTESPSTTTTTIVRPNTPSSSITTVRPTTKGSVGTASTSTLVQKPETTTTTATTLLPPLPSIGPVTSILKLATTQSKGNDCGRATSGALRSLRR